MTSTDCSLTQSPSDSSWSPTPSIMRAVSFPPMDSPGVLPNVPTPRSMSMTDAQWLTAVRSQARKLYLHSTVRKIPCVKARVIRVPLEVDSDDSDDDDGADGDFTYRFDEQSDTTTLVGTPCEEKSSICLDARDDTDVVAKLSEAETAASATRVKGLLQTLSLKISTLTTKVPNKDGSLSPSSSNCSTTETNDAEEPQRPVDWSEPRQLEAFLARCVQGWETQAQYIAQQARMQRAMRCMHKRMAALEDRNALLVWYANHLKGGAAPKTPPSPVAILQDAEATVLKAAATTMASAVDSLVTTA
ncbi:hypothetical protein SPBR_03110 [Sporothrix brasiliensis 5110]|uniref:Uncharacterized protein n=1 Tax=Sporothrix brasiliensis 5110 TaxID=1398154 RepID=A0A0C2J7K8_9PEZI|nr:uncharacterized protein SPBR_03110 [Sporothrix brasiliensis 5110]KIH93012.1 hypothetical protein SPBR_03110 [Sporothrix brasiliensis 5110]